MIKQKRHFESTTSTYKKIRHILIFDTHPDSLRLVFGHRPDPHVDVSEPQRATSSGVAFLWILAVGVMVAMFWPLF